MWKIKISILFLILFNSSILISQNVNSKSYDMLLSSLLSHEANEISVWDAKSIESVVFIDSRERAEFEVSHIPSAIWVGYENPKFEKLAGVNKNIPLIIYCSVGYRSEKIALQLEEKGFKKVYNLYGGIFEWINQGNKVVNDKGKPTAKVHAYNRLWGMWLNKGEKVY